LTIVFWEVPVLAAFCVFFRSSLWSWTVNLDPKLLNFRGILKENIPGSTRYLWYLWLELWFWIKKQWVLEKKKVSKLIHKQRIRI
jgi:hypothetical protein